MTTTLVPAARAPAGRLRLVAATAAAFYALFIGRTLFVVNGTWHATLFDDAMISMRYARNFADGYGLVWNPRGPAVQGYTNPLWTLVMAAVHALRVPPALAAVPMMLLGALCLLLSIRRTHTLARALGADDGTAACAAWLAAFAYATVFWTLRGMEVGLIALLLLVAVERVLAYESERRVRDAQLAAAALVLAMWTRTDALVPALVLLAYAAGVLRSRPAAAWMATAVVLGVGVPLLASRLYYGEALPNTYYLKLTGVSLAARLRRGLPAFAVFLARGSAPAAVAMAGVVVARRRRDPAGDVRLLLPAAVVSGACLYSIYVGGDAWEWMGYANRYIAIVLPLAAILVALGLRAWADAAGSRTGFTIALAAACTLPPIVLVTLIRANRAADGTLVALYQRGPAAFAFVAVAAALALGTCAAVSARVRSFRATAIVVWLGANALPLGTWTAVNAASEREDERAVRLGMLLDATMADDATFAVSWAGSTPYFARRTAIDLLGKTDPVVARLPPAIPEFVPGHNKWDLRYSIGRLRPDLACNLPRRPEDVPYLDSLGYRRIGGTCFVRPGARLDQRHLAAGLAAISPP